MSFDKLKWQREQRAATGNACTNKYEKSKRGFLMRKYRNMKSRVSGIQTNKAHLYQGLPILDKEDFYEWALNSERFNELFEQYEVSGYKRKLCPTPDRVDSSQGYIVSNMEWVTHSVNSARARA